ncbi:MAG TPA: urease accessory UreF family protein [Steroidobacteraceae bacterium]|nr:urease accessory UreF family protein [Steroidobacteraceae bacterium]
MAEPLALLRLLQLASPALPVGAFNFSQGLEYANEQGWVGNEQQAGEWIGGVAQHGMANLDLPMLMRLHAAWSEGDATRARRLSRELIASRESAELRAEELHMGQALAKVLMEYGIDAAHPWQRNGDASYAAMFALAAVHAGANAADCALAYAWAWAENQVTAAVKLLPLGQSAGQRLLESLRQRIPSLVAAAAQLADEDIGTATPGAMMASCWHETQYTRLFRS